MKTLHGAEGFASELETRLIVELVVCEKVLSDEQHNLFIYNHLPIDFSPNIERLDLK